MHASFLLGWSILRHQKAVVAFKRFQRQLLSGFELLRCQFLDLVLENYFSRHCGVDAVSLDGDNSMATVFQKIVRVKSYDTSLVRLRDVSEDDVNHGNEHPVFERVPVSTVLTVKILIST